MLRVLWNSKSAMYANQEKLDAISNNLTNANTDGYKKVTVSFQDLMSETLNRKGSPITANEERGQDPFTGTGVKTSGWIRDSKQGILIETGKSTDFAIEGEGYFKVKKADGSIAYSRVGRFDVSSNGKLVDSNGNIVQIEPKEEVNLEEEQFTLENLRITERGEVYIKEQTGYRAVGDLVAYTAEGSDAFISDGESYYVPKQGITPTISTNYSLRQGFVEGSNVDIVTEMTEMIITQRAFELGSRGIKTADDMWGMINNLKSR